MSIGAREARRRTSNSRICEGVRILTFRGADSKDLTSSFASLGVLFERRNLTFYGGDPQLEGGIV